jgi:hypothetical protein
VHSCPNISRSIPRDLWYRPQAMVLRSPALLTEVIGLLMVDLPPSSPSPRPLIHLAWSLARRRHDNLSQFAKHNNGPPLCLTMANGRGAVLPSLSGSLGPSRSCACATDAARHEGPARSCLAGRGSRTPSARVRSSAAKQNKWACLYGISSAGSPRGSRAPRAPLE